MPVMILLQVAVTSGTGMITASASPGNAPPHPWTEDAIGAPGPGPVPQCARAHHAAHENTGKASCVHTGSARVAAGPRQTARVRVLVPAEVKLCPLPAMGDDSESAARDGR